MKRTAALLASAVFMLASGTAWAQQNQTPPPRPFICDRQLNPETEAACWALVGATVAFTVIIAVEGANKKDRPKPVSP